MLYKTSKRRDRVGRRPTVLNLLHRALCRRKVSQAGCADLQDDICLSVDCDSLRLPTAKPEVMPSLPPRAKSTLGWTPAHESMNQSSAQSKNKQPCMHGLEDGKCHLLSVRNEGC